MQQNACFRPYMDEEEYQKISRPASVAALTERWSDCGDLPAVAWNGGQRTYAELLSDVEKTRGALLALGLSAGDRVALLMLNDFDFVRLTYALTTAGMVAVPIMPNTPPAGIPALVGKAGAAALVYGQVFTPLVEKLRGAFSGVRLLAQTDVGYAEPAPMAAVTGDTPAVILFTSGTTGKPKGAVLTHGALMRGAFNGCFGYTGVFHQRYYALIPFAHVFGLVRSLLTAHLTGSLLYLCLDMKAFLRDLPEARPTVMALVPALAEMLYTVGMGYGWQALGGQLRLIIAGGAPVPPELIGKFDKAGITVLAGYGLTETANLVSGNPRSLERPASVGHLYEGQEYRFVDHELQLRGDNLMTGYVNDPEETAACMDGDWFKTGDLGHVDADGYLYITGRKKNLIILGNGENVSPEELEALVNELPFVKDSLVREDKNDFGVPVIAVEVFPDRQACAAQGITDVRHAVEDGVRGVNRGLPAYKQMAKVTVVDHDFMQGGMKKVR